MPFCCKWRSAARTTAAPSAAPARGCDTASKDAADLASDLRFAAIHASNYLPINCRLARDKTALLRTLDQAITGQLALVPEARRAL
ncbi:MAG: hypothetical protein AUK28_08155 [Desulfobacterales bacterium CG2_30_60_27]|nr:MAG: hypothetical protein AUK28_08155 [Desulfobacterales bacterium CG2_30_60_27]